MSKSDLIRAEILNGIPPQQNDAFLSGVVRASGAATLKKNGVELTIETEKPDLSRVLKAVLIASGVRSLAESQKEDGGKTRTALTVGKEDSARLLSRLGVLKDGYLPNSRLDFEKIYSAEEKIDFLKGLFSGAGTVSFSDGETGTGYHLEFIVSDMPIAEDVAEILRETGITKCHVIPRKYNVGVYVKDREQIADFLVLVGATKSALELQSAIAVKELRNNLNRQTNVQTANLDKTVNASQETIVDILFLKERGILAGLPARIVETAEARVENPEASMAELAERLGVTKSGLTHRLDKIKKYAREARERQGRNL